MKLRKCVLLISVLFLAVVFSFAQNKHLGFKDRIAVKREILRTRSFEGTDTPDSMKPVVYVIDSDLKPPDLPWRKNFRFVLTDQKTMDKMALNGVDYFELDVSVERRRIFAYLTYTGQDRASHYGTGNTRLYICRRLPGSRWQVKGGKIVNLWIAEGE
ncbi:MAG: hypothetical protein ABI999_13270 [Acidobacteriota bacterium]